MEWYVEHISSDVVMTIIILLAVLMLFGGFMIILSFLE
jgi:hypothetical protein